MKRVLLVVLVLLVAGTGSLASAAGGGQLNGKGAVDGSEPEVLTCEIRDETGAVVSEAHVSNPWSGDVVGYWVWFGGGAAWTQATVTIAIKQSQLPEKAIVEKYKQLSPYPGGTLTPFAITDWAGIVNYGFGQVRVVTNTEMAFCQFTILPY